MGNEKSDLGKAIQNGKVGKPIGTGAYFNEKKGTSFFGFGSTTPLMLGSTFEHVDVFNVLLKNGANINEKSTQGDAFLMCVTCGGYNNNIVKVLLANGVEKSIKRMMITMKLH